MDKDLFYSAMGTIGAAAQDEKQMTEDGKKVAMHQAALGLLGGIFGYFVGKRFDHPYLGVFGGMNAGSAAAYAINKMPASAAASALIGVGSVGTSLYWREHPALGYVAGWTGMHALTSVAIGGKIKDEQDKVAIVLNRPALPAATSPLSLPAPR